jgi:hypothetical protein
VGSARAGCWAGGCAWAELAWQPGRGRDSLRATAGRARGCRGGSRALRGGPGDAGRARRAALGRGWAAQADGVLGRGARPSGRDGLGRGQFGGSGWAFSIFFIFPISILSSSYYFKLNSILSACFTNSLIKQSEKNAPT